MLVEKVMTPKDKLIIVSPMVPVREALMLMKKNKVKAIIVEKTSENGAYGLLVIDYGILTMSDIIGVLLNDIE